jgi:hypothetical protein
MDTTLTYDEILGSLRRKRQAIEEAILIIERLARDSGQRAGAPPPWVKKAQSEPGKAVPKKRRLTPQGRKRIADAMKKRWAAKRAATAAATKPRRAAKKQAGAPTGS